MIDLIRKFFRSFRASGYTPEQQAANFARTLAEITAHFDRLEAQAREENDRIAAKMARLLVEGGDA